MNNDSESDLEIQSQIRSIVKLFLSNITPSKIFFPSSILSNESSQLDLLRETVLGAENSKFKLNRRYLIGFLKEFIKQAEDRSEYVADALYETLVELVNENAEQPSFFKIYQLSNGSTVRVCENANTLSNGSTGLSHWQATYYLAQYVERNLDRFKDRRILELGAGLGLLGLTIIQLAQPRSYVFTDYNSSVLRMLAENIASTFDLGQDQSEKLANGEQIDVNDGATTIRVQELDWTYWRADRTGGSIDLEESDLIVAADVAYDPNAIPDLARIVSTMLESPSNSPKSALIAHTIRHESTYDLLRSEFESRSCKIEFEKLSIPDDIDSRTLPNSSPMIDFDCVLLRIYR